MTINLWPWKFDLVCRRAGRTVVYWPGVVLASIVVTLVHTIGVLAVALPTGYYTPMHFVMLPWLLTCVVGINTRRGLRRPPHDVPERG